MTGTAALTLDSGGLLSTGNPATITGGTVTALPGELIVNTAANLSIGSVISASSALTKTGTATLTLSNTSAIAGDLYINQGTLAFAPSANASYAHAIHGVGTLAMSGTATSLSLSGTSNFTGSTNVTAGTLAINGSLTGGPVAVSPGAVLAVNGNLTGGGQVTLQSGSSLGGSGSIAGSVTISAGTVTVAQQTSGGSLTIVGGLNVGGSGSLTAAGTASTIAASLNYTSSSSSTFAGTIAGANSTVLLNSPSSTTLCFSASNRYGGGTIIQSGLLLTSNSSALGSGSVTMSGGTLDIGNPSSLKITLLAGVGGVVTTAGTAGTTMLLVNPSSGSSSNFSGTIANHGSGLVELELPSSASGTLILSGTNTYTGGTVVNSGTLIVTSISGLATGTNLTVGSGSSFSPEAIVPDAPVSDPVGDVNATTPAPPAAVPEPRTFFSLLAAVSPAP
jgi:autotransporter-associated beta strand protein